MIHLILISIALCILIPALLFAAVIWGLSREMDYPDVEDVREGRF